MIELTDIIDKLDKTEGCIAATHVSMAHDDSEALLVRIDQEFK